MAKKPNNLDANIHKNRGRYNKIRSYGGSMPDLGPIEFRSSWERNLARILNYLKIEWTYEPKRFWLADSMSYLPDFQLLSNNPWGVKWIEVKGLWNKWDKAKIRIFLNKYPAETLKIISKTEYQKLTKTYKPLISTWETRNGKKKKKC